MRADVVGPRVQGPSPSELARMERELSQAAQDAARAQVDAARAQADAALAQAQQQLDAGRASQGETIERHADGHTVIRLSDGRTFRIDAGGAMHAGDAVTVATPGPAREAGPPQSVIVLTGLVLFFITLMVIGWPIARAMARRMDRRDAAPTPGPGLDARLVRIEHAVEAIAVEVERVSENQRFATRLLTERAEAEPVSLEARETARVR